jgi:hypothetical protein
MQPAFKYRIDESPSSPEVQKEEQLKWETRVGKMIFYITCATSLWFFYWLNGIQCPC